MAISFYRPQDPYGCFSNFSRHPLVLDGHVWPTSEHYFQAMKFWPHRPDLVERVRDAVSPAAAAALGRDTTLPIRADWDSYPPQELWDRISFKQPLACDDGIFRDMEPEALFARTKDIFMYLALEAKFRQNDDIRKILLTTGEDYLIEDTHNDPYWANGPSKNGPNKLGRLLMVLRTKLV